ncbi:MAG: hypothetical protein ACPG31_13995 [Planctomycetota bacterium]
MLLALPFLLAQSVVLEMGDFNHDIGIDAHYHHQQGYNYAPILPFNPSAGHWDFSSFNFGGDSRIQLVSKAGTPYANSFPNATSCAIQDIPGTDRSYFYQHTTTGSVVVDGFGVNSLGINITGDYNPDWVPFQFPMQLGDTGFQTNSYSYNIIFITVTVTENRTWDVAAEGTVRVPGVPYDMPCVVLHEYVTITDSLGATNENYHLYSWLTPGGFAGANGVAALQSNNFESAGFLVARNAFVMGDNNLAPEAAMPSLSVDTNALSLASGGTVQFSLDAGVANAGKDYQLLGSLSGASPGTVLPGGFSSIPVNFDPVAAQILALSGTPTFANFSGTLDASGQATATLNAPGPMPLSLAGAHLDFAFTTLNPFDFQSHTVWLEVGP